MKSTEFLGSIVFEYPEHLSDVGFWHGHIPFAFWCIDVMQPRIFVELGTHKGDSYCAFCQAVHKLGLPTACYAVDTWQGDQHVGAYGEDVYETLQRYHDQRYGGFSRLVRATFDEAIGYFADGSIDLLHIDGVHTYESVKHDFETWLPKLSGRAVTLFHDINVRQRDFGAWRFWEELCERYPHFSFLHSHGLGVLAVGQKPPPAIERPCGLSYEEIEEVRSIFARLGHTVSVTSGRDTLVRKDGVLAEREQALTHLRATLQETEAALAHKNGVLAEREQALTHLQATLQETEAALAHKNDDLTIQCFALKDKDSLIAAYEAERRTFGAQVGRWLSRRRNAWAPPGSPQGKVLEPMIRAARSLHGEGVIPFVRRAIRAGLHKVNPQRWPAVDWLHTSGLFDPVYYLATYPDVAALRMDPAEHYIRFGWKEGRDPHPLFDTSGYLEQNPDVANAGINPLYHYVTFGLAEGRNPLPKTNTAVPTTMEKIVQGPIRDIAINKDKKDQLAPFRLIAFYLPQFHTIPENDNWWGAGFTEWTNVTRAKPMYTEHYQPRRPGEFGYYDLRVREIRHRQVELARKYGIYGFCYYYYWFSGRKLLEKPLELMLADNEMDFPFCVCWANENWTRRWDGAEHEILMEQKYTPDDPEQFIHDLLPILTDKRYITVDGSPLLLIYRPAIIPELQRVIYLWRKTAEQLGIPSLRVCGVQSFGYATALEDGLDAMVEFPPHSINIDEITDNVPDIDPHFKGRIYSYSDVVKYCVRNGDGIGLPVYRGLMTGWDNTARRGYTGNIFHGATPQHYEVWLRRLIAYTCKHHKGDHRLIFINAWNEWGEGTYLEPDEKYQYGYLEATARAVFDVPESESLIQTLCQITSGNEEAQHILDQLQYALHINNKIINLLDTGVFSRLSASRNRYSVAFHPVEDSRVKLPSKLYSQGIISYLETLHIPNYDSVVNINKAYDVLLKGWIVSTRVKTELTTPILLVLTNLISSEQYIGQIFFRVKRDDVAKHLKKRFIGLRPVRSAYSLFSGYDTYLNMTSRLVKKPKRMFSPAFMDLPSLLNVLLSASL